MSEKKVQIKRQIITDETYIDTSTNKETNIIEENVFPIIDSDHISMADGKTLTESLLNLEGEDYSSTITQDYHIDRVGGDSFKNQAKSGKLENIKLYGRTVVNMVGDHGSSPVTTNGNGQFKPNENMDSRVRVIDGQMDDLIIKGQSTYNILPDRTCCSDDVTNTNMSFSFKDGLDSKIMMDTGLSDKMVLKGNTMTNIVREPIGYASTHQIKDNVTPGISRNTKTLINVVDAKFGSFTSAIFPTSHNGTNYTIANMLTSKYGKLKLGTTYTVIMDIVETNAVKVKFTLSNYDFVNTGGAFTIESPTVGRFFKSFNIVSEPHTSYPYMEFVGKANLGCIFAFKNLMIIEGDVTDIAENLPYFTGTMSVNMEDYAEGKPKLVTKDADRTKIYGQTLVDVLGSDRDSTSMTLKVGDFGSRCMYILSSSQIKNSIIKPSTKYIMRFKVSDLDLDGLDSLNMSLVGTTGAISMGDLFDTTIDRTGITIKSNGIYTHIVTTVSSLPGASLYIKGSNVQWEDSSDALTTTRTLTISEISMYEYQEGMENWDLPYMLGTMAGTGIAKIESICNGGDKEFVDVIGSERDYSKSLTQSDDWSTYFFKIKDEPITDIIKPSTEYLLRYRISNLKGSVALTFINQDGSYDADVFIQDGANTDCIQHITLDGVYIAKLITKESIPSNGKLFIKFSSATVGASLTISEVSLYEYTPDMDNMELPYMIGSKRIGYYGERKREYTLPSGLELRSLPNGIRDEFDFESGILTRRVGQMTLNGSEEQMHWMVVDTEGYKTYTIEGDYIRFWSASSQTRNIFKHIPDKEQLASNSPNLPTLTNDGYLQKYNGRAMALKLFAEDDQQFQIKVKISDLESPNKAGLAKYLAANNVTFQYPMKEPEYINLSGQIMENGEYKVGERVNGYQDGYNPTTRIYTKRIETITLDGSEAEWKIELNEQDYNCQRFSLNRIAINAINNAEEINIKCNSNIFTPIKRKHLFFKDHSIRFDREFIALINDTPIIAFRIHTSRLFENSVAGFKDYLSRNPITVHYVLADEVETQMTQEEFNALTNRSNPKLHYFENGSLKCTCLSGQPKGSIRFNTPTSNYYAMQLIKPDTKYTVNNFANMYIDGTKYVTSSTTPNHLRTPSTISSTKIVVNPAYESVYPMIVEGEHTKDEIRFYGMKSSTVLMRTRGKNLFDKDAIILDKYQNYYIGEGNVNFSIREYPNNNHAITDFIPIKPNKTYIKQSFGGGAYYDINKNAITTHSIAGGSSTFISPPNARYCVLNIDSSVITKLDDIMIMEASETNTTYEPYGGRHEFKAFVPDANGVLKAVELNRINDDLCDEIDLSTGIITRKVGKITIDGSEPFYNGNKYGWHSTIYTGSEYNPRSFVFALDMDHKINPLTFLNDSYRPGKKFENGHVWEFDGNGVKIGFVDVDNEFVSLNEFKRYVKANPVTVIFRLAEPYTEQAYVLIDGEFKTGQMLPNGVSNGYNPITKTMTTRVGSKTYDGNYNGNYTIERTYDRDMIEIVLRDTNIGIMQPTSSYNTFCEKLTRSAESAMRFSIGDITYITLPIDKIGYNLATFNQYTKSNPITIYYQLAPEYVTTETLETFDNTKITNSFPIFNEYGYKVELNSEVKLTRVIHHLPTKNMVFIPNIEPSTVYSLKGLGHIYIDGFEILPPDSISNLITTPSTITSKKIMLRYGLSVGSHSLIKYSGYENNFSTQYNGFMRSGGIVSVKNPVVKSYSKNILTDGYIPSIGGSTIFTDVVKAENNGEYHLECKFTGDIPSNKATWLFMRFNLDSDMLFNQYDVINYSLKLKCSNVTYSEVKIVQPSVAALSTVKGITSGDIDEWTTFSGSLTMNRSFRNSEITGKKIIFELCFSLFFEGYNTTSPIVDITKPVIIDVKDVMVTKNTDVSKFEDFKEPSTSNFTIQKAVAMEPGSISESGWNIENDIVVRSVDYIKVIPGLIYYLYNGNELRTFNINMYDENKLPLKYAYNDNTCRVLIPDDTHYIRINMAANNYDNLVFKADLPLHRINDEIYDEIDVPLMRYTRRVGKLNIAKLLGSNMDKLALYDNYGNCDEYGNCYKLNNPLDDKKANDLIICNTLTYIPSTVGYSYSMFSNLEPCLYFKINPEVNTPDKLIQWFKNNPTDILYELKEPDVFYLDEYTDVPLTLPNVYKDGFIQLDSSSEVFPVIDYKTRSNNYFETCVPIGGGQIDRRMRIKASIRDPLIDLFMVVENLGVKIIDTRLDFDGDITTSHISGQTISTLSLLFDTDHIQDVLMTHLLSCEDGTLPYTNGLDSVRSPQIRCIGNNLFDGSLDGFVSIKNYHVKSLNLKPNTNYYINAKLTGNSSVTNNLYAISIWKYGKESVDIGNDHQVLINTAGIAREYTFNTYDYEYKLAVYMGTRHENEFRERYKAILDNYKIELYEVGNGESNEYKANTCRILDAETLQEIELRSDILGEYRDEVDLTNSKLIQRCAVMKIYRNSKYIKSLDIRRAKDDEYQMYYFLGIIDDSYGESYPSVSGNFYSGNAACYSNLHSLLPNIDCESSLSNKGWQIYNNGIRTELRLNIPSRYLRGESVDALYEWLENNPLEIIYPLETPIERDVKIIGNPIAYTNGNIVLESEGQIPTMEYNAIISANQQVKSSTDEVNRQQDEIDILWDTIQTSSEEVE